MSKSETPPSPAPRSWCRAFASLIAGLLLLATVAGFGGRLWWVPGLLSSFRFQLLQLSVLTTIALLLGRWWHRWRIGLPAAFAMVAALLNGFLIAPLWLSPPEQAASGPAITIVAVNLNYGNARLDERGSAAPIAKVLDESEADVIIVEEITAHRLGVLSRALPNYRHVTGTGRPDPFGIALFVRKTAEAPAATAALLIESAREIDTTQGLVNVKSVELLCQWRGKPLSVLGMHTISAVHARSDQYRAAMLDGAAQWARTQQQAGRAVILCGDLNATPWCAPFIDLCEKGELLDSHRGFAMQNTWPSNFPGFLRIPIDHCLHSKSLITRSRKILHQDLGSDHLPLLVTLQWR